MGDGRTPTITVVGADSEGTVTFVDVQSTWPFSPISIRRRSEVRETRDASTGANKTFVRYRLWNGSEQSLPFTATLPAAEALKLYAIAINDPPACTVAYLSGGSVSQSAWNAVLDEFELLPDVGGDNDASGPTEYVVSGTFLRVSA